MCKFSSSISLSFDEITDKIGFIDYSYVMFQFRMKYRGIHNIVDAAMLIGGPIAREVTTILFLLTWM